MVDTTSNLPVTPTSGHRRGPDRLLVCPLALLVWLAAAAPAPAQHQGGLDLSPPVSTRGLFEQAPVAPVPAPSAVSSRQHTDVVAAFGDSFKLLAMEHVIRISFQDKTRRELRGPFWGDYRRSVRVPAQWEDGDVWMVNYIGHPIHGAAAGYNWLQHGPDGDIEIGGNPRYWSGRARATAWAAAYSLQFEIGPLSEASIGNVGLRPETTGWVDHVVTPVGALGLMVAEDALDRYFVKWVEAHTTNRVWRASLRLIFNPARTLSNAASGRAPWHRDGRTIGWR